MSPLVVIGGVAAGAWVLNRVLRHREEQGDFDPQVPSSAATPGLRRFLDYSDGGWRHDGSRQRPS
jgi:hypothetical protein